MLIDGNRLKGLGATVGTNIALTTAAAPLFVSTPATAAQEPPPVETITEAPDGTAVITTADGQTVTVTEEPDGAIVITGSDGSIETVRPEQLPDAPAASRPTGKIPPSTRDVQVLPPRRQLAAEPNGTEDRPRTYLYLAAGGLGLAVLTALGYGLWSMRKAL